MSYAKPYDSSHLESIRAKAVAFEILGGTQDDNLRWLATVDAIRAELDAAVSANHSAAVCAKHTSEFVGDDCLVCEVGNLETAVQKLTEERDAMRVAHENAEWRGTEAIAERDAREEALREAAEGLRRIVMAEDLPWCHAKADALVAKIEAALARKP